MANIVLTSIKSENFACKDIHKVISGAIDPLTDNFKRDFNSVVIKPNLCYYWDYSTGETTDPRVVSAIIDFIRERLGDDIQIIIAEADASAMMTKHAFKMLGYEELSERKKVKLVNLSEGNITNKEVQVNGKKLSLKVNEILCESNLILNVPKLKYHRFVGITCGLKNMFGAISTPRKYVYHPEISETIVGINKIVKSDLTIVDGIIAKGRYPKKMGVILASDNVLSADYIAAKILGYNPKKITHIDLARKEKIGELDKIELIEDGISLEEVQRMFPKQNHVLEKLSWDLQLKMLRAYSKILGDTIPPILHE